MDIIRVTSNGRSTWRTRKSCVTTAPTRHRGPTRCSPRGWSLLQGLALCGRCGHRMTVHYQGSNVQYLCRPIDRGRGVCAGWFQARDRCRRSASFSRRGQTAEIELGLAVLNQVEQQTRAVEQHGDSASNAPSTRRSSRSAAIRGRSGQSSCGSHLECEWNEKLREIEELEREREEVKRREKLDLSEEDRARILTLSRDLSRVWNAKTTTNAERKNLLRMLVREVTLSPISVPDDRTQVRILWQTGQ